MGGCGAGREAKQARNPRVRVRREEDVTVGISCERPDQDEEADKVIFAFYEGTTSSVEEGKQSGISRR